jgi:hypothetical protein
MSDIGRGQPETDVLVGKQMVFDVYGDTLVNPESFYYPAENVDPEEIVYCI